jgi:hypothetical protein
VIARRFGDSFVVGKTGGVGAKKALQTRLMERKTDQMHCSDFCSDSTIIRTHPDTAAHNLLLELNTLSSVALLSRNMLREVGLMSWAQEVSGSNPDAPTNSLNKL